MIEFPEYRKADPKLAAGLRALREATVSQRSSERSRATLMAEFDRIHRRRTPRLPRWALAAAAAIVLALAAGLSWRTHAPSPAIADVDDSDFVAVPYAPPLAAGELVSVVRTELYPAALDRMGFDVPAMNGQLSADVMLGQDGLPRAVRIVEDGNL